MKAFVLNKWPYSETDWIVEFYVETGHLVKTFATGARRSRKRFPHQFHAAGLYEITYSETRLQACELLHFYENLPKNLELWSRWLCILEWVRRDEASSCDFTEIHQLAEDLDKGTFARERFYVFFIKQLERHGILSQVEECLVCGENLLDSKMVFSFKEGGVCHEKCQQGLPFTEEARQFVRSIVNNEDAQEVEGKSWSEQSLECLELSLIPSLEYQLGQSLKSFHFLQKIRNSSLKPQEKSWQKENSTIF